MGTQTLIYLCNTLGHEPSIAGRKDIPELFRLLALVVEAQARRIDAADAKINELETRLQKIEQEPPTVRVA